VLQYILNDKEVQVKTELWMTQNAEYLKEQKGGEQSVEDLFLSGGCSPVSDAAY